MSNTTVKKALRAVAGSTAAAAALAGIAVTTAAPANAAPKYSAIYYSDPDGAWGWAMLGKTPQESLDLALNYCRGAGGTNCTKRAASPPGGCVALARNDAKPLGRDPIINPAGGAQPTAEAAVEEALDRLGGKVLVATCSGLDNENAPVKGGGGVSPLPAAPAPVEAPAAPAAPAAPVPPPQPKATVISDVDVYDVPGGEGNVTGVLRQTDVVDFWGCIEEQWCHVTGDKVPNGDGWVWGDFLQR